MLCEIFPESLDIGQMVYSDHAIIHSGDLGGPPSLHPNTPARPGELGVKRALLEDGLRVLIRAGLAEIQVVPDGIRFAATEEGPGFVDILAAPYVGRLRERARWFAGNYYPLGMPELRDAMTRVFNQWAEEFNEAALSLGSDRSEGS